MSASVSAFLKVARWCTIGSAVSIMFSIAASETLLALALVALLLSGEPLRLPRIKLPLALFLIGTLVSLAFSGHVAEGLPQVRKMYLFCVLLVVFSVLRDMTWVRRLVLGWACFGAIPAIWGIIQFAQKMQQARELHSNDYTFYVGERIKGFMSHWNTFSAQQMFALLMLAAFVFYAPGARKRLWLWICCGGVMAIAILLAETRAVWLASVVGGMYLLWCWRRWLVLAVPVLIAVAYIASPPVIHERFTSFGKPQEVDSNRFHVIMWRTGLHMIEAHPFLGIGPEGPNYQFSQWVPADVPRPLPQGWYGHLHNMYLQYAAERGIPTMLIMMWILAQIIYDFWRGIRVLPPGPSDSRFLLHGGIAVVLATLVEGFAEYNLGISGVLTMFLAVVGCGYLALEKDVVAGRELFPHESPLPESLRQGQ